MDTNHADLRGWTLVLALGALALAGCGATSGKTGAQATGGNGVGVSGAGGSSSDAGTAGLAGAGAGGAAGGSQSTCPGPGPAVLATNGEVDLPIQVTVNQTPMMIGSPTAGRSGLEYKLSALKFFLAEPTLVDARGGQSKAQIVGADGQALPYGIQLVDADDPATLTLHLSAPQGSYSSLNFGVGVPADCNRVSSTNAIYPLNPDGEMFWTWGSQFLFIRIEGATRKDPASEFATFFHHIGYDPSYAHITVQGSITVGASGSGPTLSLDVDLLLAGGDGMAFGAPSGSHGVPDGWVIDNLETQPVFTLIP